jgi:peptidoglycan hydrolase CwlO-like protein
LKILQSNVNELKKELDELKEEWNEFKKPISDEIF